MSHMGCCVLVEADSCFLQLWSSWRGTGSSSRPVLWVSGKRTCLRTFLKSRCRMFPCSVTFRALPFYGRPGVSPLSICPRQALGVADTHARVQGPRTPGSTSSHGAEWVGASAHSLTSGKKKKLALENSVLILRISVSSIGFCIFCLISFIED